MERTQGFFAALKQEVARRLSPARARRRYESADLDAAALRFSGPGEMLAPLMEGPDPESGDGAGARREGLGRWVRGQLARTPSSVAAPAAGAGAARNDLRLLLGVMGAPLAPVHVCAAEPLPHLSIKDTPLRGVVSGFAESTGSNEQLADGDDIDEELMRGEPEAQPHKVEPATKILFLCSYDNCGKTMGQQQFMVEPPSTSLMFPDFAAAILGFIRQKLVYKELQEKNPEENPHPTMCFSSLELVMLIFSCIL